MKIKEQIEQYVQACLQVSIQLNQPTKQQTDRLPMLISGAFELLVGELYGKEVLFAHDKTGTYSPVQLKKVANLFGEKLGLDSVFVFEQISSYNQTRLIQHRVDFIVIGKLMYMPGLLINMLPMRKTFDQTQKMPATAQLIVLYHIECEPIIEQTIDEIAKKMEVSYATCNKAILWLRGHDLATVNQIGKQKLISLDTNKQNVWNKSLKYMYSPVERMLYTDKEVGLLSGYNALATYSQLVRTDEKVYAWAEKIPATFSHAENEVQVQIWRYDPKILSKTGVVDPLSLYLTLRADEDERVSLELDNMVHNIVNSEE